MAKTKKNQKCAFYQTEILHIFLELLLTIGRPFNFSDKSDLSKKLTPKSDFY